MELRLWNREALLFSISEFHQYAVQIARLWKFSQFILILYHVLYVVLLL